MASSGYCYSNISSNNHQMFDTTHENMYNTDLIGFQQKNINSSDSGIWQDDDPSMRCVFPCEPNERPSQGLSLSLSSTNPSTIGLQSFELRNHDDARFQNQIQIQNQMMMDHHSNQVGFMVSNSKYLGPAQELLNEFCNLGIREAHVHLQKKNKQQKMNQWQDESASSSLKQPSDLHSLELLELQKRKSKLLLMLEEVDKRYQHYRNQMKAVVSSFEAVAGNGAATVYSALASKAMSRHFRCLREGIVGQIKATKRAMGDKDMIIPGSTRGETPRLRVLDQTLRQQRAFQQMSLMETHPWRPQRGLPERSVSVLRAWLFEHFLHPYPSDVDKHILARQTGLSRSQVSNWFINARVRLWKPMVEEMYIEETKDQESVSFSDEFAALDDNIVSRQTHTHSIADQDHKPTPDQLVRIDSECLSSIINHPADPKNAKVNIHQSHDHMHHQSFGRVGGTNESFGAIELDFSTYNHNPDAGSYATGGGGGGGVSLTLGLQQQTSLFYGGREHMEDCEQVQYSFMDGEAQNLPYRNLMGAQLLRDLV